MKKMLHASLVAIIVLLATSVSAQQLPARHPANQSLRNEIVKQRLQQSIAQSETADPASTALPPLGAGAVSTNVEDSLALVDLYNATNGPSWSDTLFWFHAPVSSWGNITTEVIIKDTPARVSAINLNNNNLNGTIPESIGALDNLYVLNLSDNNITGKLPASIGNLASIYEINLHNNQLTDSIPTTINITNNPYLYKVTISNNHFTDISSLSSLFMTELYIENNNLTFSDIEPIFSWDYFEYLLNFTYSPQADVGTGDTVTLAAGSPLRISITGYTPAAHDEFQWYHNETLLPAAADSFIAIPSVAAGDAGNYRCEITNTVATALTLYSKNFRLEVGSGGENTPPVANAGPDQTVDEGTLVTLNGSASSDADSDPLTYEWTAPEGITLSDNTLAQPTFTAPTVATSTTYEFSLVVNDGTVNSLPDIVVITVNPTATVPPTLTITDYTLPEAEVECFNAQQTITVTGTEGPVTFENNSVATLIAGQNIVFMPGFHAVAGSNVHAYISDVFCVPAPIMAQPEEKSALVDIEEDNNTLGSEEKSIKVFPNPSEGLVSIALSNYSEPALVNVYSLQGKSVASILVNATATIDLGHLQKGLYIVKVSSNDDMTTKKLMLK